MSHSFLPHVLYHILLIIILDFLVGPRAFLKLPSNCNWHFPFLLHYIYWYSPHVICAFLFSNTSGSIICCFPIQNTHPRHGCQFSRSAWIFIMSFHFMGAYCRPSIRWAVEIWIFFLCLLCGFRPLCRFHLSGVHANFFCLQKPVPTKSQRIGFILLPSHPYETAKIAEISESSFIIIWDPRHPTHPQGHHNPRLPIDTFPKSR